MGGGTVVVYTDGSSSQGRKGGYGVLFPGGEYNDAFGSGVGTNNCMELVAIRRAIEISAPGRHKVVIHSDSRYCVEAINVWSKKWKRDGWVTSSGTKVANSDMISKISRLMEDNDVEIRWVKGHSSNELNNRADELARRGRVSRWGDHVL